MKKKRFKQLLIEIAAMNVEEQFQIPAELEITSLPALALYREGSFKQFIGGVGKKAAICDAIFPA